MQTTYLQAMIARNAAAITREDAMMQTLLGFAKEERDSGERAFALDYMKKADKKRRSIAKLVELQCAMLAELKGRYREARNARKLAKINAVGGVWGHVTPCAEWTSEQTEDYLDAVISCLFPAKSDSRKKVA